jgi:hypothetical protein
MIVMTFSTLQGAEIVLPNDSDSVHSCSAIESPILGILKRHLDRRFEDWRQVIVISSPNE